jgi:Protein of unknown function (DUF3631)
MSAFAWASAIGVQLLADCRPAFDGNDRLSTKELRELLIADEEKPWATWHHGSPISPRALARMLQRFGIRSRTIRLEDGTTPKGYMRESFEDDWKRYLRAHPPDLSAQTPQPASVKGLSPVSIRHTTPFVANSEHPANPHGYSDVADSEAKSGDKGNGRPADVCLGDEMFPVLLADAVRDGHVTEAEANECYELHNQVVGP